MECHKAEYDQWQNSHHDRAMEAANHETVLGYFNYAVFEFHGVTSRFYRKDDKFFVHTQGPDGKMGEFEITHTFGWHPLQQYLVPFPGGRLQCLPIAWDVKEKNMIPRPIIFTKTKAKRGSRLNQRTARFYLMWAAVQHVSDATCRNDPIW